MKYNKQIKKGKTDIKSIKLSFDEKGEVYSHLDIYMKENPLKAAPPRFLSFNNIFTQFQSYKYSYSVAFVIVFLFAGVGVIEASEKALPGDLFYPIKIKVIEPVKTATKFTAKAKEKYQEEKFINRLVEVQDLAKKGEFKNEKRIQAEKEVENSVKVIVATKKKNKALKATTTVKVVSSSTSINADINISKKDYNEDEKHEIDFNNKINTRLEEIKKADINIDKTEVVKFEEKIKNQLKDAFDRVDEVKVESVNTNIDTPNTDIKVNTKINIGL